jgi:hypothetical protein
MFSMNPMKKVMTAGLVAAALGVAPALATAQETGTAGTGQTQTETTGTQTGTDTGTTGTQPGTTGTQPDTTGVQGETQTGQGGGGADQEAVRQHLSAARQSLAELTQLPAAGQLQGEQRTQVSDFISRFNEFATATTDWRERYERVDESLDRILDTAKAEGAAGVTAGTTTGTTAGADAEAGAAATTGAGEGSFDPSIISKLRETRQHLDAFELATGDPGFIADRIERILENASSATTEGAAMTGATVGTTGSTAGETSVQQDHARQGSGASATGMVTLSQSQLEDIKRHLEMLRRR